MEPKWLLACDVCEFRDRPVVIVGTRRFSTEILANYICNNTPANWSVSQRLEDVSPPDDPPLGRWRLIFIDCLGFDNKEIVNLLTTEGAIFLQHDIVALFNLAKNNADLSELVGLGVRGFFFETDRADFILKGICALKNGELWVPRVVLMKLARKKSLPQPSAEHLGEELTRREREILLLLAKGANNQEISSQLFISLHTVKTHVSNILKKLGVQNRLQAGLWAAKHLK